MEVYSFGPENLIGSKKFCFMGRAHKTLYITPSNSFSYKEFKWGVFSPGKAH
jgi:hypothetical protein